jgi:hypothetical protein
VIEIQETDAKQTRTLTTTIAEHAETHVQVGRHAKAVYVRQSVLQVAAYARQYPVFPMPTVILQIIIVPMDIIA